MLFWTLFAICLAGAAALWVPVLVVRYLWRRWRLRRLSGRAKIWSPTITAALLRDIKRSERPLVKK